MSNISVYELQPDPKPKGFKKWMGIVGVASDGRVFVPGPIVGWSDMEAMLIAGWENSPIVQSGKTTLIDARIILEEAERGGFGKEGTAIIETVTKIKNRALEAHKKLS